MVENRGFFVQRKSHMLLEKEVVKYTYEGFIDLTEQLLAIGQTTGSNHTEVYLDYTRLNLQRMKRIHATTALNPDLQNALSLLEGNYVWLVLVESWCGDVAQNLPVIAKVLAGHANIDLQLVLRDENLELMNQHLTNGGQAIPKMLVIDALNGKVITTWGPRPEPAQELVLAYKALENRPPYSEFSKTVHEWYAKDHGQTIQKELLALVEGLR
jgi:hypothetical protein